MQDEQVDRIESTGGRGRSFAPSRVISEVLIIVVGVLIALAAESFRQSLAADAKRDEYIAGLVADLRADSAGFVADLLPHRLPAQAAAVDTLVALLSDETRSQSSGRVLQLLLETMNLAFVAKRRSTFDDLVSSGQLSLIDDADLRAALVEYYSRPVVADRAGYDAFLASAYYPYVHRLTVALGVERFRGLTMECPRDAVECFEALSHGDELTLLRQDPELAASMADQTLQRFFLESGVRNSLEQAAGLLERLRQAQGSAVR